MLRFEIWLCQKPIMALLTSTENARESLVDALLQETDEPSLNNLSRRSKQEAMEGNTNEVYHSLHLITY